MGRSGCTMASSSHVPTQLCQAWGRQSPLWTLPMMASGSWPPPRATSWWSRPSTRYVAACVRCTSCRTSTLHACMVSIYAGLGLSSPPCMSLYDNLAPDHVKAIHRVSVSCGHLSILATLPCSAHASVDGHLTDAALTSVYHSDKASCPCW